MIKGPLALSLGLFLALLGAGGAWMGMTTLAGALDASRRAEAIAERLSGGFDPVYQVSWVSHKCEGFAGKWIPGPLSATLCPARIEIWRGGDRRKALEKVAEHRGGIALRLIEERGPLENDLPILWNPEIKKGRGRLWH